MPWQVVVGAVAGGLSYLGSRNNAREQNAAMERQHELNLKQFDFNLKQAHDAWVFADEGVDIQMHNDNIVREHAHQTRVDEWVDRDKMRIFDYNNQMAAYNASIERFDQQIEYNDIAEGIALNDTTRKYNETLTKIGFQNEDLQMKLNFDTRELLANIQGKRAETTRKGEAVRLEGIVKAGKVAASGQVGRTAARNLQSVEADMGRTQMALIDAITRDDSAFGFNLEKQFTNFAFGQEQLQETLKSAKGQFQADNQGIALERWQADMAAKDQIAAEPTLAPELSKPREIPTPEYQRPKHPWGEKDDEGNYEYLDEIMDMKPVAGAAVDTTFGPLVSGINTGLGTYTAAQNATTAWNER